MSYNMWFVTPAERTSPAGEWIDLIAAFRNGLRAELVAGSPEDWRQIHVADDDWWWFDFERYSVTTSGEEWAGDLDFFRSWLAIGKPAVNARWVEEYLRRVRTVYTFRCSTSAPESNMDLVNDIVLNLQEDNPSGLLYAELEGWSNEYGEQITWEFSDRVTGERCMALRQPNGWVFFHIDLGSPEHRLAFQAGEIPPEIWTVERGD